MLTIPRAMSFILHQANLTIARTRGFLMRFLGERGNILQRILNTYQCLTELIC